MDLPLVKISKFMPRRREEKLVGCFDYVAVLNGGWKCSRRVMQVVVWPEQGFKAGDAGGERWW
jgi:hypothetical protein